MRKEYYKEYMQKRRNKLKAKGICTACGNRKAEKGKVLCTHCLEYQRKRYEKIKEILEHANR